MTAPAQSPLNEVTAAQGAPVYLGSYNATTTAKTNAEVTTAFNATGDGLAGKVLLIHNTGTDDVRVLPVAASTGDVTTVRDAAGFGVLVSAGAKVTIRMQPSMAYLSVICPSSTATVDVWELT